MSSNKGSILGVFSIILLVIILAMGGVIYKLYTDNKSNINIQASMKEINEKIDLVTENIDELDKKIDKIGKFSNSEVVDIDEENEDGNEKEFSLADYIGTWNIEEGSDVDYLKVIEIGGDRVVFDWNLYRLDLYEAVVAKFTSSSVATFKARNNNDEHEIEGKIVFVDGKIKVEVTGVKDEKNTNLKVGDITVFSSKAEQ